MTTKAYNYRSSSGNVIFKIIEDPENDWRLVVFYLNVEDQEKNIVFSDIVTLVKIDGVEYNSVDNPDIIQKYLNEKGGKGIDEVKTIFTCSYSPTTKDVPFTNKIDYILPKSWHEIVVITPEGEEMVEQKNK